MFFSNLATTKNRWYALIFIAFGLAIVIIDNTILNVSIPYILRDLNASFSQIQWVISGYALVIATVLITFGRLGDLIGRKKMFLFGMAIFATGSFIGSIASNPVILIFGRSFIQGLGAAMTLTSALALLAAEFQGKERAIAFGIWGSIAGASASIGPLLGGYLTSYYSWRWSLRINVVIALIAILGSVFIKESKGEGERRFDRLGMVLSGIGLFSLVFGFIEGSAYGWLTPKTQLSIFGWAWPFHNISVIPFIFAISAIFLAAFVIIERGIELRGRNPLLRMSLFRNLGFSTGLTTLLILSLGQFGFFFILPIYYENVLGMDALGTGIAFLPATIAIFFAGIFSGFLASKINPKWVVNTGMIFLAVGAFFMIPFLKPAATILSFAPALIIYGIGLGLSSSQLTNIVISAVPLKNAGEASGASATMRQVGASIGVAILGTALSAAIITNMGKNIAADRTIPESVKPQVITVLRNVDIESGQINISHENLPQEIQLSLKKDVDNSIVDSSKNSLRIALIFIIIGAVLSLFIKKPEDKTFSH